MKKIMIFILLIFSALFISCKNEKQEVSQNISNAETEVSNFVKKHLDFCEADDALIGVFFKNKDFLSEDEWKEFKVLDSKEEFKGNWGDFKNYILVIANQDISNCDIKTAGEVEEKIFSFSMKRGEAFVLKNYDKPVYLFFSKEGEDNIQMWGDDKVYLFRENSNEGLETVYTIKSWTKLEEEVNFDSDESKIEISEEIDLNKDNQSEKIHFISDDAEDFFKEVKTVYTGTVKIDDNVFTTEDLVKMAGISSEENHLWGLPLGDMEIIDMDPKDKYKELIFKINSYSGESDGIGIVFHYKENALVYIGHIIYGMSIKIAPTYNEKDKTLNIMGYDTELGFPYYRENIYKLENEKIVLEEGIKKIREYDNKIVGTVNLPINIYKDIKSKELLFKAEKGRILLFIETDQKSWIKIRDFETGKEGYIRFDFKLNEDGFNEIKFLEQEELKEKIFYEIFDHLPAYG
ncbi:MAG: hypothetical protein Q4A58_01160 [Fusobacterium sp.]|uniref:hypothetical protein n=1 Tax=Fusobacterium sp. TaxID=68766 RepID=UPI0026DDC4FD|nr:hypothetical protein [Fusobacterium sp.]MDO4689891.1 hypothetical protein [Fusobacterium sp.]